ncbi:hypothetical protein D1B31_12930 [Neobacillus notoginsengisoli]|uniref:DUF4352 domain-containing protein n=1 Tax=Neobacillus notoginsengisoli TaxID=1578198 RepID=A0A417YSC4_9BACI|nr:hypothetical protein [Neobacillus notoginsengisoli]RHW38883.1 hypothetical protein D1B31_12930 [Neobacillus notoginsengisoli]
MGISKVTALIIAAIAAIGLGIMLLNNNVGQEGPETAIAQRVQESNEQRPDVQGTESPLSKTDAQGAVTIRASILPEESGDGKLTFEILMNTHSVDLSQYNLAEMATISSGGKELPASFEWKTDGQDSHHMKGMLVWTGTVSLDKDLKLVLKDIGNIPEKRFFWKQDELRGMNVQ